MRWTKSSDEALRLLFEKALQGDEVAYRAFLEQIAHLLRKFFSRSNQAEDLVQEVLISIHRKRDLYQPGMPVMPWVRAIAKHRLIDSVRADNRRPKLVELTEDIEFGAVAEEIKSMDGAEVEKVLACLDDKQREILKLAKLDEMPYAEIAERLNMSLSAVKVSVFRSLNTLRRNLDVRE